MITKEKISVMISVDRWLNSCIQNSMLDVHSLFNMIYKLFSVTIAA